MSRDSVSYNDPVDWIQSEFSWRQIRNPRYSLRSFARFLGISSGRLSELMAGKRLVTEAMGERFASKLGYKTTEKEGFILSIKKARSKKKSPEEESLEYNCLSEGTFKEICDWYYLAILNVITLDNSIRGHETFAKRLGLHSSTARNALKKLESLGLVKVDGTGQYMRTSKPITTTKDIPSVAIRRFQGQILDKAQQALIEVPAERRDFSTSFVRVDRKSLKKIKAAIESSRRSLATSYKSSKDSEIYALNIQFFPLTMESVND